jgi:hypothetical protein
MALIKLAKPEKDCPSSWLAKAHQKKRPHLSLGFCKMITETSLLPLTLITSVKESNN